MSILITGASRPDLTDKHDEQYDLKFGRYAVEEGTGPKFQEFVANSNTNIQFFFDNQWIHPEDTDLFFKDKNNNATNRIKVIKNFIKPTVTQYMGNARIMNLGFEARPISHNAITRKEAALARVTWLANVAAVATPELRAVMQNKYPIGESLEEAQRIFENTYQDDLSDAVSAFITKNAKDNDLENMKVDHAFDLSMSGVCAAEYVVHNQEFKWEQVLHDELIFDRGARKPDAQDGEFMGTIRQYIPSEIFERWPNMSDPDRKDVKEASTRYGSDGIYNGRIAVYRIFYRTTEKLKFGYVKNEYDDIVADRIDYIPEDETEPEYTDKDLVPVSELNEEQLNIFDGKNSKLVNPEVIRFIEFIPSEIVARTSGADPFKTSDIVLASGVYPWQDTEYLRPWQAAFPIKMAPWMYYRGHIDSPVSSLINPQRMINRYESIKEQRVNSHNGETTFVDKSAIDGSDLDEAEVLRKMHTNEPVILNARGKGLNNAVANIGGTLGAEVNVYSALKDDMKMDMDRIIGVNESLRGEAQGQNKLVGVTELEIQRASLIQEPFYGALTLLYQQIYQATANVGKRVAIKNNTRLIMDIGEKHAKVLQISGEAKMEDHRIYIKRVQNKDKSISEGNNWLNTLIQLQLIDKSTYADLFNRSTLDDIAKALRTQSNYDAIKAAAQAKQDEKDQQTAAVDEEMNYQRETAREDKMIGIQQQEADKDRGVKLAQQNRR